jgi:outer membrane protein TolC
MRYVDYWRILRAVALNRDQLGILPELRRVSLAKYAAGLVGQQEPLQIDAELAMLDHETVILERQRLIAVATLNVLMHEPAENVLPPPPDSLPLPDGPCRRDPRCA